MAQHLDLEEQEQLEQLKHFWKNYGNLITWLLIAVMLAVVAWFGYQKWQSNQADQAAAFYDEFSKPANAADPAKQERVFNDMKERFPNQIYTYQAGLALGKAMVDAGKPDAAKQALSWVAEKAQDAGYASIAKLRLSSVLLDEKAYDAALKALNGVDSEAFAAIAADRRGDILLAQGKKAEAKVEYEKAYKAFAETTSYRYLVEVKLNALGVNPKEQPKPATPATTPSSAPDAAHTEVSK